MKQGCLYLFFVSTLLALLSNPAFSDSNDAPGVIRAGLVMSTSNKNSPEPVALALYIELELLENEGKQYPGNVKIWTTPGLNYRPNVNTNTNSQANTPSLLVQLDNCGHSQKLFDQFTKSPYGGGGKPNLGTIPIAIHCDQTDFLFIYMKRPIDKNMKQHLLHLQSIQWMTKKIKLMWSHSYHNVFPLEDLNEFSDPKQKVVETLKRYFKSAKKLPENQ